MAMTKQKQKLFDQLEAALKERGYDYRKGEDGAITTGRPFEPHRGRLHAVAVIFVDVVDGDRLLYYALPLTEQDGHLVLLLRNGSVDESNRLKTSPIMAAVVNDGLLSWVEIGRNDAAVAMTIMGQGRLDQLDEILELTAKTTLDVWETLDEPKEDEK